ncbi:ATP-dependent metallopeptidase FtsH/Yme1/Tma family protein [Allorhizobium undicola]|uniref:hypothetical protein n=1 Tax=Allorhizobium undicola TaxID=78527 RepID=UPI00048634F1|nr:hypothetical protein [Allorhizobium undicola]
MWHKRSDPIASLRLKRETLTPTPNRSTEALCSSKSQRPHRAHTISIRLGTHIRVGLPDARARAATLRGHLADGVTDNELDAAARECDGVTGADLAHAAKGARRRGDEPSIDDLRANLPPVSPIEGELRERIAVREAGHAAAGLALDVGTLTGVVVRKGFSQDSGVGGGTVFEQNKRLLSSRYFLDQIAMNLGGMAAEIVIYGEHLDGSGGGAGSDLHNAADLATIIRAALERR